MSRTLISALIWLAAAAGAGVLWWYTRGPKEPFPGLAGEDPTPLSATAPGRVLEVLVEVGDAVAAGQVVARLDSAEARANVEVARAELAAALGDVEAESARVTEERRQAELEILARTAQARAAIDETRSRRAAAQAELRSLSGTLGRMRGVEAAGLARGDQVADLESRRARVQGEASFGPEAVEAWKDFSTRLEQSMENLGDPAGGAYLKPFQARVELARRMVDMYMVLVANCDLVAPKAGRISRILLRPGMVVTEGLPVIELVEPGGVEKVVAWLPEARSRLLSVGDTVTVLPVDREASHVKGTVTRVGPALEPLPPRLWLDTNTPSYGRVVHIRAAESLLPGEAVQVLP